MHKIVTDKPQYRTFEQRLAKLAEAERKFHERVAEQQRRYQAEVSGHQRATQRALEEGALLPGDVPKPPEPLGDGSVFLTQRLQLRAEQRQWLAKEARKLGLDLRQRESKLLRQALDLVRELNDLAVEFAELNATAQEVRAAADDRTPVYRGQMTAVEVVQAVMDGTTFQDPPPKITTHTVYLGDGSFYVAGFPPRQQ